MEIFLIRHAIAVPRGPDLDDAARPLTRRGRKRWARAVRGLARLGIGFDRIYHSPWLRAVETADALATLLDGESIVTPYLAMSPGAELIEELSGERIALVGHEPWLGELLASLLFDSRREPSRFELRKGGVAWLVGERRLGGMRLRALLTPKVLRAL